MDLAIILVAAGVITVVFKWLKQPLVLGYILAGFFIGPYFPWFPAITDADNIHVWSDIGIVFLMFGLGLEFSIKKLKKVGATGAITALTELAIMFVVGNSVGRILGLGSMECTFLGCMLSISSTSIIIKSFDDMKLKQQKFTSTVTAVLVVEDLVAVLLLVVLSTVSVSQNFDGGALVGQMAKLAFFLVAVFIFGIYLIPTFLRWMRKYMSEETLLILAVGLCFGMVVLASKAGFSTALGAFVMGAVLSETIEADVIHRIVTPLKNLFSAVFFVSVGMLVDPQILIDYAVPIVGLVLTILIGQSVFGSLSFMLGGESLKSAMRCGFSMAQIGEFSFIIASLGLSLGVIGDFLYPVVVAVSVITTFLTPYMIRLATPAYNALEHRLPNKIIRSLNHLSMSRPNTTEQSKWKRLLTQMGINTVVYSILTSATIAVSFMFLLPLLQHAVGYDFTLIGIHISLPELLTGLITLIAIAPFLRAMVMKKNRSEEWKALWAESNRNRLPLLSTILARAVVALSFIFYVCHQLGHFSTAVIVTLGFVILALIIVSRAVKHRSIVLERLFINNLRSRDIEA